MKKLFYLIIILFIIVSCTKENNSIIPPEQSSPEKIHVITKKQALQNLKDLLVTFKATKSDDKLDYAAIINELKEENIKEFKYGNSYTKSSDPSDPQPTPILYYINFESGGSAVLSADDRIPEDVLALTESGSIDSENDGGFAFMTDEERSSMIEDTHGS